MILPVRELALKFLQIATYILPEDRKDWAMGMQAELDHLPARTALSFAWGCIFAAVRMRVSSPSFALASARWFLALGAVGWSALHFWFANTLPSEDLTSAATLSYATAVLFALGGFLTALFGLKAITILAPPLALLLGAAIMGAELAMPTTPEIALLKALAIEDLATLVLALLIALGIPKLIAARAETGK